MPSKATWAARAAFALISTLIISPLHADTIIDGGFEPPNPTASGGNNTGYVNIAAGTFFGGPSDNA